MPKKQSKSTQPKNPVKKSTISQSHALFLSFLIVATALLLLFYPGDSFYVRLFSFNRNLFQTAAQQKEIYIMQPVPYVLQTAPKPFLTAVGVYVIDLPSATPVYVLNENLKLFPASTTKVITALTARDVFKDDDVLLVKRVIDEGQTMGLVPGERITFENLLYGLLVHSGNDAAYVIADNYPGGYDAFITSMNEKAQSLGMKNSLFHNPAGLDSATQLSTAFDLALAGRELLRNKDLAKIVSTKSITVSDIDYTYFHPLYNVNKLLGEIPGVAGLKTGKTDLAGENLITLYKRHGHEYLIVLLNSEDRFTDTQTLVQWLDQNVQYESP